jgi:hypothetical protein
MTEQQIQEYRDAIRFLMRVYLSENRKTLSEFARDMGMHHNTVIQFDRGSRVTRLNAVNKIEVYLRSKMPEIEQQIQGLLNKENNVLDFTDDETVRTYVLCRNIPSQERTFMYTGPGSRAFSPEELEKVRKIEENQWTIDLTK